MVTFLTGASSGLGYSLAMLLAAEGGKIALAARREAEVQALAERVRTAGGQAIALKCDVGDRAAVQRAVDACEAELGPIDLLICNAGIGGLTPPEAFDGRLAEQVLRTNLLGAAYCIEAVMPGMIQRRNGHIVGISSLAAFRGLPNSGAYCASKAGMNAMLESLRPGLRKYNVSVTIINPGFVKTPMTAKNRNRMPFLLEQDQAARMMYRAIRKKKTTYSFPWQLALVVKIGRLLPDRLYDLAFGRATIRKDPH